MRVAAQFGFSPPAMAALTAAAVAWSAPALAQGKVSAAPSDLIMLCAGWEGVWRADIDASFRPGEGWGPSGEPADWSVEETAPGQCIFTFGGQPAFVLDTTEGYYDTRFYEDGTLGPVQRGQVLHAELADPKAWNIVVQAVAKTGTYRMQMTMAGEIFMIYLTEPGAAAEQLKPHGIAVHRRH